MKKVEKLTVNIIEVFEHNFITEIKRIGNYIDEEYNYIGMDTEFPGSVYSLNNYTPDFYYKTLKINVDALKLIQIGITLCNINGEYPPNASTWQFNLKFNYEKDKYAPSSFAMLNNCGIDFETLKTKGIPFDVFAEYMIVSGLVINPSVHWISFHGSYDFAYMLKLLMNNDLPDNESEFTKELITYFPNHYDIRILIQGKDNLKGGLNRLAQYLEVLRVGKTHQAGSDSVVTADVFFKLIKNGMIEKENLELDKNILYGLGQGADDNETINYTQIGNGYLNPNCNIMNMFPTVSPTKIPLYNNNGNTPAYIPSQMLNGYAMPYTPQQMNKMPKGKGVNSAMDMNKKNMQMSNSNSNNIHILK